MDKPEIDEAVRISREIIATNWAYPLSAGTLARAVVGLAERVEDSVLLEVLAERARQDAKWGEQNHPSVDPVLAARNVYDGQRMCEEFEIPTEERAKFLCEEHFRRGDGTFAHIAVEELAEVVACDNEVDRRTELVQLAAVIVAWIQKIDRSALKGAKEKGDGA